MPRSYQDMPKAGLTRDISMWHLLSPGQSVLPTTHFYVDTLAKRSIRFSMIKMVSATPRTLNPRNGSPAARPKLALIFGILAVAIAVLAALSWFQKIQVDEARSAQVILNQIAVLTRRVNNLTLTALNQQNLTPAADAEMLAARHALPDAVLAAHVHA